MLSLMNHLVRVYLKKWDKELEGIRDRCQEVQNEQLKKVLDSPLVHVLHKIRPDLSEYDSFRAELPVTTYEDIRPGIEKLIENKSLPIKYFAQSSGTTSGLKKLIPTPEEFVKINHLRGSWYILHTLYEHDGDMDVFRAKNLLVGGSMYGKLGNSLVGDISGIMIRRIPSFFRPWYTPDIGTATHPNWEVKLKQTSDIASREKRVSLLGGIPTWVLSICRKIKENNDCNDLTEIWPNLKAYVHGGVNFDPYRHQFEQLIPKNSFRYIEVYNASEGFFAYQDRPYEQGMLLMCASGIFYEFIEVNSYKEGKRDAIPIDRVELGISYVMLISTISGLLRYVQGDIVVFETLRPFRIKVNGRISDFVNAFGEDLLVNQIEEALARCNQKFNVRIHRFTVAPHYITLSQKGWHDWYIHFESPPEDLIAYQDDLDEEIQRSNQNYAQKRTNNMAMENLKIHVLPKEVVLNYFTKHSSLGGQSKLQKVRNDRLIADRLEALLKHGNWDAE